MTHAWPRARRICRRSEFLACYDTNRRYFSQYFVLFVRKQQNDGWRVGFTVTKKMGNAVRRNNIRRLLREFFRLHGSTLPQGIDIVVVPKKNLIGKTIDFYFVQSELAPLVEKLARKHGGESLV